MPSWFAALFSVLVLTGLDTSSVAAGDAHVETAASLINDYRRHQGFRALLRNEALDRVARRFARELLERRTLSHIGKIGSSFGKRAQAAGYGGFPCAENLAAGQRTGLEVVRAWVESEGHQRNILLERGRDLGIARVAGDDYGPVWVMVVGCVPGDAR